MQARVSGPSHQLYPPSTATPPKVSLNWDLDDWKWDGDLFLATPTLNMGIVPPDGQQLFPLAPRPRGAADSSNASPSCSEEATFLDNNNNNNNKGKGVCDKRRRVIVLDVEDDVAHEAASLTLKLGGPHPSVTTAAAVSTMVGVEHPGPRALCQVQNCGADLSNAKDYHRRHKVCAMHAKASNAMVGNVVQRFCQQCSRFHLLQEFDEGKRSCRRRLAGHNKRRRKTQPDANIREHAFGDERTSNYLLITLLKILSALNSSSPVKANDHDLISHLLRSLSGVSGASDGSQLSGFLPAIQEKKIGGASLGEARQDLFGTISNGTNHAVRNEETSQPFASSSELKHGNSGVSPLMYPAGQSEPVTVATLAAKSNERIVQNGCGKIFNNDDAVNSITTLPLKEADAAKVETNGHEKIREWSIDLNNTCNETDDFLDGSVRSVNHANGQIVSGECAHWALKESHQFSPPQISGNSDSASAQSLSSSNGDTQNRTDRIVFKLFGKDPSHFPLGLRSQIFEWLSNSPTDIESYIRPGCIILTLYLRLSESTWEELCGNLRLSFKKLLELSNDSFWQSGWIYARIHQQIAFIYDGHVVLDTGLGVNDHRQCCITSITPIAVTFCEQVNFIVKGINLCRPSTRLLCAFEGDYILLESSLDSDENRTFHEECEETQVIGFSCSLPSVVGRGFVEVEDHGLSCSFFPFIVADGEMVSEIRFLESVIDAEEHEHPTDRVLSESKLRNDAINYLHEMGWLLKRSHQVSRLGQVDFGSDVFSLGRFKWLLEFSMDHDWCAVVKKLLDVLFEGTVDVEGYTSREMLLEMGLLHRAVRRNCRAMVEFLLRYVPTRKLDEHEADADLAKHADGYLFRPDMPGPAGMTPLHIAASRDNAEMVLDALIDDPGQVGVGAWKVANDNYGFAPQDYARLRGYFSYIHLVQRKIRRSSVPGHCILDIPGGIPSQPGPFESDKLAGFEIEKSKVGAIGPYCKVCAQQQLVYSSVSPRSLVYRPAMLSLVAIAAVCVCVALLFKGPPEVVFVFPPFRWERLGYGAI